MENDALDALRDERDRIATRLRRVEDELHLISESVPAAIGYIDADERYRFVNRTFAAWLGRAPQTLGGLRVSEVVGNEAYAALKPHLVRALAGSTVQFTFEAPYPTGRRWVDVTYVPHFGPGDAPVGVVVLAVDVTQRRKDDEERSELLATLRNREARLRRLHDSGVIGIVSWTRDGDLVEANDAFLKMVGYSRDDLEAGRLCWREMTPPEHAPADERAFAELDAAGVCTPYEKEYIHKDGHRVPIQLGVAFWEGSRSEGVAWILDSTARKRIEARQALLIEIGARLASPALDASSMVRDVVDALVSTHATAASVDLRDGDATVETVSVSRDGAERGHPDDPARRVTARLVARGRVLGHLTFSSTERNYDDDDRAMADELGRQIGIAIDNARLFEAAQVERRRAEEASRAKDEFLAMVSHELRTPLNAMLGWATLLRSGSLPSERMEHALEVIDRNVRVQVQLVEDLLDISRVITGKLRLVYEDVDLPAVVHEAVDAMRLAAEAKGLRLSTAVAEHLGPVSGDPERLRQIVYNLLSNAVRHTPRGGAVSVDVSQRDAHVEITVQDTGEGIAPELLLHVFDRFRQGEGGTTRRYGGLGLGLAIVKHIVELHGGSVIAASEGAGRGAMFTVLLPVASAGDRETVRRASRRPARAEGPSSGLQRRPELAGLEVLVVDDDPDARELLCALLSVSGIRVTVASSAAEALERFTASPPDVVVSDIGMPGEDGYALIENIRKRRPEDGGRTPAIALTAFARLEDRTRALLAGYTMHLAKPIEAAELLVVLAAASGRLGQAARS